MKINVVKQPKEKALQIHKDYFNFLKANIVFIAILCILYAIGNFSEYVTFNSKDLINIQTSKETNGVQIPSLSLQTWFFFIVYWLSFYITPSVMLWFHRNNNLTSKKIYKAKKINFNIVKSFLSVILNFRMYILILIVSFFMLLMLNFLLKTFPEIKQGIDLIVNLYGKAMQGQKSNISPFASPEFINFLSTLSNISYFRIAFGFFEILFAAAVLQVVYFIAIPLVVIHKDIGVFKSLFLSFKSVIVNWHIYLSVTFVILAIGIGSKLIEDVFLISRLSTILLSVIILPYLILINKSFFKKID